MFQALCWVLGIDKWVTAILSTYHYDHHQVLLVWETDTYIISIWYVDFEEKALTARAHNKTIMKRPMGFREIFLQVKET